MYCLLIPGLAILPFVAYPWLKLMSFEEGAQKVTAELCVLPGGKGLEPFSKPKRGRKARRDKKSVRGNYFGVIVRLRPSSDEEPVEVGLVTGRPPPFKLGQRIEVLYNPDQPESVALPGENLSLGLILVGSFGLILTCVALVALVSGAR